MSDWRITATHEKLYDDNASFGMLDDKYRKVGFRICYRALTFVTIDPNPENKYRISWIYGIDTAEKAEAARTELQARKGFEAKTSVTRDNWDYGPSPKTLYAGTLEDVKKLAEKRRDGACNRYLKKGYRPVALA